MPGRGGAEDGGENSPAFTPRETSGTLLLRNPGTGFKRPNIVPLDAGHSGRCPMWGGGRGGEGWVSSCAPPPPPRVSL